MLKYATKKEEFAKTIEMLSILFKVNKTDIRPKRAFQYFVCFIFLFASLQHSPDRQIEAWTVNAIIPKLRLVTEKKIEQKL